MIKSNIYKEDITEKLIQDTIHELFDILVTTAGPFGTNVIIQDGSMRHVISKDGYTILKSIFLDGDVPRTVLEFVKRISRKLVMTVGDGSTSSVLIVKSLYEEIKNFTKCNNNVPSRLVLDTFNKIAEFLEKEILNNSIPINFEDDSIERIAAISLNNDYNTASKIQEIFKEVGKYCKVQIETSKAEHDYWEKKSAFEINSTYKLEYFLDKDGKNEINRKEVVIFMTKDTLTFDEVPLFTEMAGILGNKGKSLIVIAKDFDIDFMNFVKTNMNLNKSIYFDMHLITIALASKLSKDTFDDLAMYLDCIPYDKDSYGKVPEFTSTSKTVSDNAEVFDLSKLGVASSIRITENKVFIINEDIENKEAIDNRIKALKEERDKLAAFSGQIDKDLEINKLENRISQLEQNGVVFYVGGNSEEEKENRKFLLEDAVAAVRSAIDFGYNIGGSINIPSILFNSEKNDILVKELKEHSGMNENIYKELILIVGNAFLSIYEQVMKNAALSDNEIESRILLAKRGQLVNILTGKIEEINDPKNKTIQSVKTDIEILKASLSIIGLLATSKAFVALNQNRTE